MILKTLQWNIGGGKIRNPDDNKEDPLAYCNDDLDSIIRTIKRYKPDIITLQESHSDEKGNQAKKIADKLALPFFVNDAYAPSHLEKGQKLSQAIISRYPINGHAFILFLNPKVEAIGPAGDPWFSHDKGVTSGEVALPNGLTINIKTSHSVPYRKFNLDPMGEVFSPVREDMMKKLKPEADSYLYQGDLNHDESSVKNFLPNLFKLGVQEVVLDDPTTPKGRKYDHVLYRGIRHIKSIAISDVLTDHFPVYSEFETGDVIS